METEPYNLQSPEQIAKDYGGNKQRIAEAMQMGLLDPTAGTLAGMFIDRMRNAAQAEAAPQQSVAQQVFAPPMPVAPGAGLAGTPQAAAMQGQMPPMPGGAPGGAPMGPPPAGLAAAPMPAPGMAAGGLTTLPLPNDMFDEPGNGGYRGGGLVAFAAGDLVDDEEEEDNRPTSMAGASGDPEIAGSENTIVASGTRLLGAAPEFFLPDDIFGYNVDLATNLRRAREAVPRETRQQERFTRFYEQALDPEAQRARRQEDMWMALGQIGARMATTPGSLLQAASTGIGEALPGIREAAAARRSEERAAISALAQQENLTNQEAREVANIGFEMQKQYGTLANAMQDRAFQDRWNRLTREQQMAIARMQDATQRYGIASQAASSMYSANKNYEAMTLRERQFGLAVQKAAQDNVDASLRNNTDYMQLQIANPSAAQAMRNQMVRAEELRLYSGVDDTGGGGGNVTRFDNQGNPIP